MRILFVYSGNSVSGQNKIVESQARSLIDKGIEVELFAIRGRGFRGYLENIFRIRHRLKCRKIDIIHAHYGLSGLAAFFARRKEKLIVSFMGDDLVGSNRRNGTIKLRSRILIIINAFLARYFYDYSIVKSAEMEGCLFKNTACSLIPNGVNRNNFYPVEQPVAREQLGMFSDKKIVLFVSDPSRAEKNYSLSERAVNELNNSEALLLHATNHEPEALNLYYNAADLLLLTSFHEGSPNVIKEAMACNCPVVSTDVGDVRWLFDTIPGHFITSYDHREVAEKIKKAFEFRINFKFTTGRERIMELGLDSAAVAEKIYEVYKMVLKIQSVI